jgi:hypothetical protein
MRASPWAPVAKIVEVKSLLKAGRGSRIIPGHLLRWPRRGSPLTAPVTRAAEHPAPGDGGTAAWKSPSACDVALAEQGIAWPTGRRVAVSASARVRVAAFARLSWVTSCMLASRAGPPGLAGPVPT